MLRTNTTRLITFLVAVCVVTALSPAAESQEGDRFRVLVPQLLPQGDIRDRFGKRVSNDVKDAIDDMATHQPVDRGTLRQALRRFDLKEEQLRNCVTARQIASQMDVQLVMCGRYSEVADETVEVSADFHTTADEGVFNVPAFTVHEDEHEQAAQRIVAAFEEWVNQLRLAVFCAQYVESRQWDDAIHNCDQALEINPNAVSPLYNKAYALMQQNDLEESLVYFERVLEQNPIHKDALLSAGIVNARLNRREEAREFFDRYMELEPGNVEVRLSVATDIANQGAPLEALRIAEEGEEMAPDNLMLQTYIGHFAASAANKMEAGSRGASGELTADPMELTRLYNTAVEAYSKVYEARGDSTAADILQRMIVSLTKLEQTDRAVSIGQEATSIYPDSSFVWDAYARALDNAGQVDEALAALDRVSELNPDARVTARKANLLLRDDRIDDAVEQFVRAVENGELTEDQAFNAIFGYGYSAKYQNDLREEALEVFEASRRFATNERTESQVNFWMGYTIFQQAIEVQAPSTLESAEQALPMFQRALSLFENARAYEQVQSSIDVQRFIDNTTQYIEIQEALIARGRRR